MSNFGRQYPEFGRSTVTDHSGSTATVEFLEDGVRYSCSLNRIKNRLTVEPGDIRLVKWSDGNYYKAKILSTETDGSLMVQYLQDKVKHKTNVGCVKNCNLQQGDIRLVKWTDGKYYRARIVQIGLVSRGRRMVNLVEEDQRTQIEDKDLKYNHTRDSVEGEQQKSHRTEAEKTPLRLEPRINSCKRKLFDSAAYYVQESTVSESVPQEDSDLIHRVHQEGTPYKQKIVFLTTLEGSLGEFESLDNQNNISPKSRFDGFHLPVAIHCSKRLVDYSDSESDTTDSINCLTSESNRILNVDYSSINDGVYEGDMAAPHVNATEGKEIDSFMPNSSGKTTVQLCVDQRDAIVQQCQDPVLSSPTNSTYRQDSYTPEFSVINTDVCSGIDDNTVGIETPTGSTLAEEQFMEPINSAVRTSHVAEQLCHHDDNSETDPDEPDDIISPARVPIGKNDSSDGLLVESNSNTTSRRVYDKKFACFYCSKLYSKLPEHLELCHANEIDVAKFLSKKKGSKERKVLIQAIRNRGNFLYNKDMIGKGRGKILPCRRPRTKFDGSKFLPCEYCLGFYKKESLTRHVNKCPLKPAEKCKGGRKNRVAISTTLATSPPDTTKTFAAILNSMREDNISLIVRNDPLIMKYGNHLSEKYRDQQHIKYDIIQKMRELGRLLDVCREDKDSKINNLEDALQPSKFNVLLNAVEKVSGLSGGSGGKPTLALKIGYSLQKCSFILKTDAIMESNSKKQKMCDNFLDLYKLNWENHVSKRALHRMDVATWNKPSAIPLAQDVLKMNELIKKEQRELYEKLKSEEATTNDYRRICNVTLAHLITFNRKRVGEVERLEKSTYLNRVSDIPQGEIEQSLSTSERLLVERLILLHIRGKRGRKVPLLLTPDMAKIIDLIITKQSTFSVPACNKFIFARPNSTSSFRGTDAMKYVALKSGADNIKNLTSTKLRKHIATVSQILNLSTNDLELLSRHMGHSINVHKNYYRLPDNTLELAKVSKLLIQFDKGLIKPGETLDNISLDLPDKESEDEDVIGNEVTEEVSRREMNSPVSVSKSPIVRKVNRNKHTVRKAAWSEEEDEIISSPDLKKVKRNKKTVVKAPWSKEENQIINEYFKRNFITREVPGRAQCEKCISSHIELNKRSWVQVKSKVHNIIKKSKPM